MSVYKRGPRYAVIAELGRQPCRTCLSCRRRHWIELEGDEPNKCEKCGGSLGPVREERRQEWVGTFRTATEAKAADARVRVDLAEGKDLLPKSIDVRSFAARWIEHKASSTRPNTVERYRTLLRLYVLPVVGSMPLARVRPSHIQRVLDTAAGKVLDEETGRKLSARTVHHVRSLMAGMFQTAVAWEMIGSNPVSAIDGVSVPKPALQVPSAEEVLSLFDAARETVWSTPLALAISLGTRRSETLGLAWSAVDLGRGRVQIVRTLHRVPRGGLEFFGPKTDRSRRSIALPGFAVPILRSHKAEQAARRLVLGEAWTDLDLVCERGDGQPIDPDAFTHATKRLIRKAGLHPETRLHDLRHSLATTLLEEGIDTAVVSAVLGHSNPGFTAGTYQHVTDRLTEKAAAAIERRFAR